MPRYMKERSSFLVRILVDGMLNNIVIYTERFVKATLQGKILESKLVFYTKKSVVRIKHLIL